MKNQVMKHELQSVNSSSKSHETNRRCVDVEKTSKCLRSSNGSAREVYHDAYCRGCHARPSYKNGNTYLCGYCWDNWNKVRRSAVRLTDSEIPKFKEELKDFIKSRGRYVWHPEVYVYLSPVSMAEAKWHGIKVATFCRELGYFAPPDDRLTRETVARVDVFAAEFLQKKGRMPSVREVLAGTRIDHTTFWSCLDYDQYVAESGGSRVSICKYRIGGTDDFLEAAAAVVREAGHPLHMTVILGKIGISYPAYLENFGSVRPEEIHLAAGISRSLNGTDSLLEVAARAALNQLGWEVEAGVSFPDLIGKNKPMKFDFKIIDTNVLVEVDGPQHFDCSNFMFNKTVCEYDRIKDDYAKRNQFRLIRVDARKIKSPDEMKAFFLKHIGEGPSGPVHPSKAINAESSDSRKPLNGSFRRRSREK